MTNRDWWSEANYRVLERERWDDDVIIRGKHEDIVLTWQDVARLAEIQEQLKADGRQVAV